MKENKIILEKNTMGRELINKIEGAFDETPLLLKNEDMLSVIDEDVIEGFYKSICESIKANLFEAKDELINCSAIEMQDRISKMDSVLDKVKVGEDQYKFQRDNSRGYTINGREAAKDFLISYICPSEFGIKDSKEDNQGQCGLLYQCEDCWKEPMVDEQELLKQVKDNMSQVLDRVIMAGIKEAEKATLNRCTEKRAEEQAIDNKEVMSILDIAVKKHYREDAECLKYCGFKVTEEELRHKLVHHNCPSYFGLQDKCSDDVQERIRELIPIEECAKCWDMPENVTLGAETKEQEEIQVEEVIREIQKAVCDEKSAKEEPTDKEEVMSRLDLVVKQQYIDEKNCFKYCGHYVKTDEELKYLLIHQNCPSDFGLHDKYDTFEDEEQECSASIEECIKCWNKPENMTKIKEQKEAHVEDANNNDSFRREVLNAKRFLHDNLSIKFLGNEYDTGFGTSCEFKIDSQIKPMLQVEKRKHYMDDNNECTDAYVEMSEGRIEKDEDTGEISIWIFEPTVKNGGEFLHEVDNMLHYDKQELQDEIIRRWNKEVNKKDDDIKNTIKEDINHSKPLYCDPILGGLSFCPTCGLISFEGDRCRGCNQKLDRSKKINYKDLK